MARPRRGKCPGAASKNGETGCFVRHCYASFSAVVLMCSAMSMEDTRLP
jgi:hypothetical protein